MRKQSEDKGKKRGSDKWSPRKGRKRKRDLEDVLAVIRVM